MKKQKFPKGWDEQRVKELIAELDARTDEEWIAADEAAANDGGGASRHSGTYQLAAGNSPPAGSAQERLTME